MPRSTTASSNTCWHTSVRHATPVTTISVTPSASTANTRAASSVFFQALNALIRSNPVHGTGTSGLVLRSVSAVLTMPKHSLKANRDAPACPASTSCCSTVGSRHNRNLVGRVISPVSIPPPTDKPQASGDVSEQVITIGSHVTPIHRRGHATTPIYPTPPGPQSRASSCRNIHAAAGPAHRNGGASISMPSWMCCAPDARGGICGTTSPSDDPQPTSTFCAGAAAESGPVS